MELSKIARILYNMSLDIDYEDVLEYREEEINCITKELELLQQNNCDSTLQMLSIIALENEDMEHWKDNLL